ncbi:MAG: DUF6526 family protein [Ignavibacteria bacterium]
MKEQNYSNHRRIIPMYHILTFLIIVLLLISSAYYTYVAYKKGQSMRPELFFLLSSVVLFSLFAYARQFALKAQDRAIRAEENFRHYLLIGKPFDSRITMRQIIGLRFASDEELPELAKKAADSGMSEDEIKKSIKNWKADTYRA